MFTIHSPVITTTVLTLHAPIAAPHSDVEDRHGVLVGEAVAGVAGAEEGLVVVAGQLGKAWDELLYRLVTHLQ